MSHFADLVETNKASGVIKPSLIEVDYEGNTLQVRERGAMLRRARFDGVDLLSYSISSTTAPKPPISHACMPFGPSQTPGGQHGYSRYVDFDLTTTHMARGVRVEAQGPAVDEVPRLHRMFFLGERALSVVTTATNNTDEVARTSIGEHFYFPLPEGDASEVEINGRSLDAWLGRGAVGRIMRGEPILKELTGQPLEIALPGLQFTMQATPGKHGALHESPLALTAWKRDEFAPYICLEPTIGVHPTSSGICNEDLRIGIGSQVSLQTTLTLQ